MIKLVSLILAISVNGTAGSAFAIPRTILKNVFQWQIQAPTSETSNDFFAKTRSELHDKTQIPLRLPNLALAYKDTTALFAITEDANSDEYYIQIAMTEDCPGGNYCHVGSVIGSTEEISVKEGPRIPVTLKGGIRGFFVEADCGAHCDDSSINWREGKYYYSINLKVEKKQVMIRLANSAIERGARR